MKNRLKILLSILILFLMNSCTEQKMLIVHDCSSNVEAELDILRSLELNKEYLENNEVEFKVESDKCGFTFIHGDRSKFIKGSMTDIDLMLEIKSFYYLKD